MERKRKRQEVEYYENPPTFTKADEKEEAQLEDMLFGSVAVDNFGNELEHGDEDEIRRDEEDGDDDDDIRRVPMNTVWVDKGGVMVALKQEEDSDAAAEIKTENDEDEDDEDEDEEEVEEEEVKQEKKLQPAWEDEDDAGEEVRIATRDPKKRKLLKQLDETVITGAEYTQRLRERFEMVTHQGSGGPSWAKLPEDIDTVQDEDEEDILATAEALVGSNPERLAPSILNVTRLKDANHEEHSRGLHTLHFHSNAQLMLVGGQDKKLNLFQIDGKKNRKVQGVVFKDTPIVKAWFTPDGREAIVTGRKPWIYVYDVVTGNVSKAWYPAGREEASTEHSFYSQDNKYLAFCGKNGNVHLTSNQTKQKIADFKMNNISITVSFSPDGLTMFTGGGDASIYQWDLRTRRCIYKFIDEGMSKTSSLAISPSGAYHAVGSQTGVVNVYSAETMAARETKPTPHKALMNLQTSVNAVKFNHDTQIMGMSSWVKTSAFRLVHLPSMSVFGNWPTDRTPLGKVMDFDFSPHSGFLALGTHRGKVLLYRLNHYNSA